MGKDNGTNSGFAGFKRCSICKGLYSGWGNNAEPVNDGRCCDECNGSVVIPTRLAEMFSKAKAVDEQDA